MPGLLDGTETVGVEKEVGKGFSPPRLEYSYTNSERGGDGDAGGDGMKNPGEYVDIGDPALQVRTDEDGNTVASATIQAVVLWKEDIKNYIMDEIIKMCKEHGITDLYVLNRDFILSAIKEKMEKEAQP